jgi:hypothetical protein
MDLPSGLGGDSGERPQESARLGDIIGGDCPSSTGSSGRIDEIARQCVRDSAGSREYYVSDVLVFRSADEVQEVYSGLVAAIKRAGRRRFLCIATHNDHVHIIHGCSYSSRSCRCALFRYYGGFYVKRPNEARGEMSRKQYGDWYNVMVRAIAQLNRNPYLDLTLLLHV